MKLKELAIEGHGIQGNLHLGRLGDGLSIVYGENGAGKSLIRRFLRGTLFGFDENASGLTDTFAGGSLNMALGLDEFQLVRECHSNASLNVQPLSGSPQTAGCQSILNASSTLGATLYDTIFNVSFRYTPTNIFELASVLHTELGVPLWSAATETIHSKRERMATITARIDTLTVEKSNRLSQIETARQTQRNEFARLQSEISQNAVRITEARNAPVHAQLEKIERAIALVHQTLKNEQEKQKAVRSEHRPIDRQAALYLRLDEIDFEIQRWRNIQSEIQDQRIQLRNEMLIWNDLTLDSEEHPYHQARAILVALESKVGEAERNANHWSDAGGPRVDTSHMTRTLSQICLGMRDDLVGLCTEMASQYNHIRHKSAAAELKRLRRSYTGMGENIDRLINIREEATDTIRIADPQGADAIARAEFEFCQCAQRDGYLEACRQFVGPIAVPATTGTNGNLIESEFANLATLQQQRFEQNAILDQLRLETAELNQRHAELVNQRDDLGPQIDTQQSGLDFSVIDVELRQLGDEQLRLSNQIAQTHETIHPTSHLILQRANELLSIISEGDLTHVFLADLSAAETQIETRVTDRYDTILNFSAIAPGLQDQVYLCLILAAKEHLLLTGTEAPTLLDDAFLRIPPERVTATLALLQDFATHGHQIIALTQHRYLADRVPGLSVFELAPDAPWKQPHPQPDRQSPPAPSLFPFRELGNPRDDRQDTETVADAPSVLPYPLSKYSTPYASDHVPRRSVPFSLPDSSPSQRNSHVATDRSSLGLPVPRVSTVAVDAFADQLGFTPGIGDSTPLDHVGIFSASQLRIFTDHGIDSVGQFLDIDLHQTPIAEIHVDQLERWQSQTWLLWSVAGMRIDDARILVACGITEPEQLDTSHAYQLEERIMRFFATPEGRHLAAHRESISLERISSWYRSLDATRSRWENRSRIASENQDIRPASVPSRESTRLYDSTRDSTGDSAESSPTFPSTRSSNPSSPARVTGGREFRKIGKPRSAREPRLARPPRMNTPRPNKSTDSQPAPVPSTTEPKPVGKSRSGSPSKSKPGALKLKFFLDLSDHVEAAPSIGPKTAERFEKIGVVTVADFLKPTAESMAEKINYKRITADLVRQWQQQARLICRIPNLRNHDAQLLVACNVWEPEDLASMQPNNLFEVIGPFSETKEGQKIIRNGKKPDLAEITNWIHWATEMRSIQAA